LGWNLVTIFVGSIFAFCGFFAWFGADPANSAFRQTVAALWLIAALMGLVIAAIGVLGATIVHAIERRPSG
jgi:TRAP-type C4-dicarboxylate transport system permease small subunit